MGTLLLGLVVPGTPGTVYTASHPHQCLNTGHNGCDISGAATPLYAIFPFSITSTVICCVLVFIYIRICTSLATGTLSDTCSAVNEELASIEETHATCSILLLHNILHQP